MARDGGTGSPMPMQWSLGVLGDLMWLGCRKRGSTWPG
ncbi:hypothetical protein BJ998_005690 [Kutzneria kofuensis]|uniref:Uncharacterized protein n=1 Tax=Kutzneria kofuensis TaxID=103725 RepID=A0A7W9KL01_9PSEU|nr:hypothetical protein [Kutzneria kofuensis]